LEFYSAIRKIETIWFDGKWMQLEDTMLSIVSQKESYHKPDVTFPVSKRTQNNIIVLRSNSFHSVERMAGKIEICHETEIFVA
jgi:hypothetical protein